MAALPAGVQYGLSSESSYKENKELVFVKLTDSALKAIEDFIRSNRDKLAKPKIQFLPGNEGERCVRAWRAGAGPARAARRGALTRDGAAYQLTLAALDTLAKLYDDPLSRFRFGVCRCSAVERSLNFLPRMLFQKRAKRAPAPRPRAAPAPRAAGLAI